MKSMIASLSLICLINLASAQKAPIKFGDVSREELEMTIYDLDTTASAVVLADYGETTFTYKDGFSIAFARILRIKILKPDGLNWADHTFPLYHEGSSSEIYVNLKGSTFNLAGGKIEETKLNNKEGVFQEKFSSNINHVKITLPNVKVGSVIDLTYQINSDYLFNLWSWQFQHSIPTKWSEYRVSIPEYFSYERYLQGYTPLTISEQSSNPTTINITQVQKSETFYGPRQTSTSTSTVTYVENKFRWAAENVPAFRAEPFMTTQKDFISQINFELAYTKFPNQPIESVMGSWDDINTKLMDSEAFGSVVTGNAFLKKIAEDLTANITGMEEKAFAIFKHVQQEFTWTGVKDKIPDNTLRKVVDEKKGSSAELNMLLCSMLQKLGMDVKPVLISTRDNGFIRETMPVYSQFNYVICLVNLADKFLLLDATDKFLPMGTLPERCLNGRGLMISKAGYSWVPLNPNEKTKTTVSSNLQIQTDGSVNGTLKVDHIGYDASDTRRQYFVNGETEYVKGFIQSLSADIQKSEFINADEINLPFTETHEAILNDQLIDAGSVIYFNPFTYIQEKENPFKAEKREYPVDFGSPQEKAYIGKITIPEGYTVEEVPESRVINLPGNAARYTYNVTQMGNVINVVSLFQINKNLFSADEYPYLREFYNQVVAKQAEQIVIKKP